MQPERLMQEAAAAATRQPAIAARTDAQSCCGDRRRGTARAAGTARATVLPVGRACAVIGESTLSSLAITFAARFCLVALFPFSALDKILEFDAAVAQARESLRWRPLAVAAIVVGFLIEVVMPLAVLSGVFDRLAAFVLAGYCVATALLWKPFWTPGDFWVGGPSRARALFWDFWKNLAVAGGFLTITFGTGAASVERFLSDPLSSTRPYEASVP